MPKLQTVDVIVVAEEVGRRFLATHLQVTGQARATHVRGDGNAWRPIDGSRSG
jgi:hypothetical protein